MNHTSIAPLADSLHRIDAAAATRSRLLFCESLSRALNQWVPGLTLVPGWAEGATPADEHAPRFGILLRGRCAQVWLLLPAALDDVSAAILAAGAWSSTVQLSCLCVRAKATLGGLMQWLGKLGLDPVRLEARPGAAALLTAPAGTTAFVCHVGGQRIEGWLDSADTQWLAQAEAAVSHLGPPGCARAAGLVLPLRARLGARRLPLSLLRSLEAGDVVLLDQHAAGPVGDTQTGTDKGTGRVLVGARRGRGAVARACSYSGHQITILGDRWMNAETLQSRAPGAHDTEPAAAQPRKAADPMADIEVDLHFELEVLSTPLAELAAMRPGYVLELPVPAAQACVSLVVGGQVVGRAELVSIGDRLGARILELFHVAG